MIWKHTQEEILYNVVITMSLKTGVHAKTIVVGLHTTGNPQKNKINKI